MWASTKNTSLSATTLVLGDAELRLSLVLPSEEIQPLFSGGAWAGTVVWQASLFLCDFLAAHLALVRNKHVMELGAGIGAPGMAACILGASRVTITEQSPLDELIVKNSSTRPDLFAEERLDVRHLDWSAPDPEAIQGVDVVLVSDCIYEGLYGESWRHLANVISAISRKSEGKLVALNCVERRNGDGIENFLRYCDDDLGLKWHMECKTTLKGGEEIELWSLGMK